MVTAEEAAALEGAMEESAGLPPGLYFGIIWIIITAIVCLLVGFLIGTRARQIAASAKTLTSAFLHFSFKIPEGEASIIGKQDDDNGGEDDEKEEAEEGNANVDELDAFIQPADTDSTLQDHPDLTVNPVMTYKIKRAKDEARAMQRRLALIAEGFDEKEVDERMEIEGAGGGGGGGGKQNALATLIAVGANVEGKRGGASEENALLQERRRLQRNVDAYLKTSEGIEKFKGDAKPSGAGKARDATGGRIKTASEVATETSHSRFGGEQYRRFSTNPKVARDGRFVLKRWGKANAHLLPEEEKVHRGGGAGGGDGGGAAALDLLDANTIAALEAELKEDEEGEEGEEDDDEGEEGGEGEALDA